jgi:primosomal protein N' (replication factor Y)
LSDSQQGALARIVEALDGGGGNVLLHGATGSGKTEVYLQACAAALERGKGAIVLVSRSRQTAVACARFGDRVAVFTRR